MSANVTINPDLSVKLTIPGVDVPISEKIFDLVNGSAKQFLKPPERITVSQWADRFRILSPEYSAAPGKWETNNAPYLRAIMDSFSDPDVEEIVVMASAQVGKSEAGHNCLGYVIKEDPGPILVVQPTVEMAETWSKDRLSPMLRDTPTLRGLVTEVGEKAKTRSSGNTILHKHFPGGLLNIAGANSPAGLASRPIRYLLFDEIDKAPPSAGTEGDPITLAKKRTTTFWNRKIYYCSTPTIEGASRIQKLYLQSDQRQYFVPCPHCNKFQILKWSQVKWPKEPEPRPEEAVYICEHCNAEIDHRNKRAMLAAGEWRARRPFKGKAGFHISELYSPWSSWGSMAEAFLEAHKGGPEQIKSFVNTCLGECWKDNTESVDEDSLYAKNRDFYPGDDVSGYLLPEQITVLTAGVDVQDTFFKIEVVGWGVGEESWGVEYIRVNGKPSDPRAWEEVEAQLQRRWLTEDGRILRIAASFVDTGFATQHVYKFVKPLSGFMRVRASKGIGGAGKPAVQNPTKNNRARVEVWPLGVDTLKDVIYSRLKKTDYGAGFCHFPKRRDGPGMGYDREYFEELTAEEVRIKYRFGFPVRYYEKKRPRNEGLDCRVYAYAALLTLSPNITAMLERLFSKAMKSKKQREEERKEEAPVAVQPDAPVGDEPRAELTNKPSAQDQPAPLPLKRKKWRKRVTGRPGFSGGGSGW
jgi:phage terminase large subunit GpA-like protein